MPSGVTSMTIRDDLHRSIAELRDENGLLREQVRQLNALLMPAILFPKSWRLSKQERRCVGSLYASRNGFRTKEALHTAISNDIEVETDEKLVDVIICKIRGKLPDMVTIETIWGEGYRIPARGRAYIAAALGHPSNPESITEFIKETNLMSFDIIKAPKKAISGGDANVLLRGFKNSNQPALIVSLRAHFATKANFKSSDSFSLHIGIGDKKGFLRLARDAGGGFKAKPLKNGAISFNCGHIERFGSEAEPKESVRADLIDADTVEIVLPRWSEEIED